MPKTPKLKHGKWPAQDVEMRALEAIRPYEKNTRTHAPEQVEMLAKLFRKYGVDQPIVVDEHSVIIKGHGRRLAAYAAGFEAFPVVVHRGLSDTDKQALRIADNQSALLADWDNEFMRSELKDLDAAGYEMELLGFDADDLSGWGLGETDVGGPDPDAIPEPVRNPVVRQGDIWLMGDHRLLCGDATLKANWDLLLNPVERAALVFTDPPYGVSYAASANFDVIRGDDKRRDDLYKMLVQAFKHMARFAREDAAFYIWHASATRADFSEAMAAAGLLERQYLIWVKPGLTLGHADYGWQHEPCFYASKTESSPAFYGDRTQSTVWRVAIGSKKREVAATVGNGILILDGQGGSLYLQSRVPKNKKLRQLRITAERSAFLSGSDRRDGTVWEVSRDGQHVHPTQKPVELARRAMENSSRPGDLVLDPFLGSGTTLIAAEATGRKCYGCELDPIYAEVIVERWEKYTKRKAANAATGLTLEQTRKSGGTSRSRRRRAEAEPTSP